MNVYERATIIFIELNPKGTELICTEISVSACALFIFKKKNVLFPRAASRPVFILYRLNCLLRCLPAINILR